ncbi:MULTISPECIES: tyrosine-type recombinase/integrase [Pseudomonas]|nr:MULTISPECIES: site-specific integrase [Pseudomonas]MCX9136042.1 site-specific integrase [Pseudomonas sp. DCB_PUT]MDD1971900.1 site-specific integrase [Pseudomonas putida]MDO1464132.1 tyrosine-type recombinase/integrase [Pseudomonas putida]MDO1469509.1 tyrosine-type recombinase/integrase [Pseudomonas putida]MDZ7325186.1 tyrosine-type recombinase/integrase [Pseudomonas sp. SDS3-8]
MLTAQRFMMTSGERYVVLLDDESNLPDFNTNLFLTSQIRNADKAYATLLSAASHLRLFFCFLMVRQIDLHDRYKSKRFLLVHELDALRDFCAIKHYGLIKSKRACDVDRMTLYARLSTIAKYCDWLIGRYFDYANPSPEAAADMVSHIRARRPRISGRAGQKEKALSSFQVQALDAAIAPESPVNIFEPEVQFRNYLIIRVMSELGIRAGELLGIRLDDLDFGENFVRIARRPDQVDDPRSRQPLVKTLARTLPMSSRLGADLHKYIIGERRKIPNSRKCPYLFITHKSGPSQGQPLSIAGYQKVWRTLQQSSLALAQVHGHRLRHTWNQDFSEYMDALPKPPSEAEQESIRSKLMGWRKGSGSAKHYNERFVSKKANQVGIELQEKLRDKVRRKNET